MVVTLMPPAVEAEPPPTNISASVSSIVTWFISFMSTRLKPPDRVMTEANTEWMILSPVVMLPIVAGLDHSASPQSSVPATSRMEVTIRVSLVCSVHFWC